MGFPEGIIKIIRPVMASVLFMAAYTGTSPNKISLNPIQSIAIAKLESSTYTGFTKIKSIGPIFNRFSISHMDTDPVHTLTNYQTNLEFDASPTISERPRWKLYDLTILLQY